MDIMANSIALITKYSTEGFDKVYKKEACSSRLDAAPGMFQFTGTKSVKIMKFAEGGLSDYTRNNVGDSRVTGDSPFGYASSNMGGTWEDFTISQDRAAKYPIEYFDNEEAGDLVLGTATTRITTNVLTPEVDAYCFSKLASLAGTVKDELLVTDTIRTGVTCKLALKPLNAMFKYFDDEEVPNNNQIIFVSTSYFNALREDQTELVRFLPQADFDKSVSFKVTKYEDRELVIVPPRRFQTGFKALSGGYTFADNGLLPEGQTTHKPIDFIGLAKDAAIHIVKYNKIKILSGDVALAATNLDGYAIYVRIYHDLFVMDNKRKAVYLHLGGFADADYTNVEKALDTLVVTVSGGKVASYSYLPENKLITLVATTRATLPAVGSAFTLASETDAVVRVGDATAATKFIAVYGGLVSATYTIA